MVEEADCKGLHSSMGQQCRPSVDEEMLELVFVGFCVCEELDKIIQNVFLLCSICLPRFLCRGRRIDIVG